MNQSELISYIDSVKMILQPLNEFETSIDNYNTNATQYTSDLVKYILNTSLNNNNLTNVNNFKSKLITETDQFLKTIDMLELMRMLTNAQKDIEILNKNNELDSDMDFLGIKKFFELYDEFIKLIQKNLQSGNKDHYISLYRTANGIISVTDLIRVQLDSITSQLSETTYDLIELEGKSKFELKLYRRNEDLNVFIRDLKIIEDVYDKLALLFQISLIEHPLEIIKVETGSTDLNLLGAEEILKAIGNIINMIADVIFKKFTFSGKIQRMDEVTKVLKENLNLSEQLKANGIDVEENDETIKSTQAIILNDLYRLVSKNPAVKVNGQKSGVDVSLHDKYIDMSSKYLIEEAE